MKAKMKEFNEIGFGNQAIIPGGKYGAKRVELKDWLTTALSQVQAEAIGEVEQYILGNHDYGAIPETNEYANGWNDSRKRAYQQLKYLLSHFTNQSKEK